MVGGRALDVSPLETYSIYDVLSLLIIWKECPVRKNEPYVVVPILPDLLGTSGFLIHSPIFDNFVPSCHLILLL